MIRTTKSGVPYWLGIISARRPENVNKMLVTVGPGTWVVPQEEASLYEAEGAAVKAVSAPFPNLVASRNLALDLAFAEGLPCVQTDDDFVRIKRAYGKRRTEAITFDDAVELMIGRLQRAGFYHGAVAPTTNAFFVGDITSKTGFCIASLCVTLPCSLRFDDEMTLKEDYDYTLQHIAVYGGVVRSNDLLAEYQHYSNSGGAVEVRSTPNEQRNIAYLKAKWGKAIRDNPRRPNEILLSRNGK
jgi:hypothetical protein